MNRSENVVSSADTNVFAFVGAGNMAQALIRGLVSREIVSPTRIRASDPREVQRSLCRERYGIESTDSNVDAVRGANTVILGIKPQIVDRVLSEIRDVLSADALVISIAAGWTVSRLEERLTPGTRVVRTMPNVCSIVGEGATAIAGGSHSSAGDIELAREIFESVGMALVIDESLLDAVTGLSGSGPAYIFMIIEALADAGVKVGLGRLDAHALACQTVLGAAKLTIETKDHPGRLRDMVCSPGGTAIAAVHTLEEGGLRTTLINAVESATRRARELGDQER